MALKKLCPGCGKVISYNMQRCEECAKVHEERVKQRYKEYKANRTDIKEQKFYSSVHWIRIRDVIKQRDKGLCQLCLSKGDVTYMDTVHHIIELKEDWDKRLEPKNLICLCESCHQEVHNRYLKSDLGKRQMQDILMKLL